MIQSYKDKTPVIGQDTFVAQTAAIIGDVTIGKECSVWYSAVIRGDVNSIQIGDRVSVQDCTVIHVSGGEGGRVKIGNNVIIGHNATVHGCTISDNCLIGMGSTILDGAIVSEGSIVAAGALVLGKTVIGPYQMWAGVPAKFVKNINPEAIPKTIGKGVQEYVKLAKEFNKGR